MGSGEAPREELERIVNCLGTEIKPKLTAFPRRYLADQSTDSASTILSSYSVHEGHSHPPTEYLRAVNTLGSGGMNEGKQILHERTSSGRGQHFH